MKFGEIIEVCKDGQHRAARKGWNGKNMYIYIEIGKTIPFESLREPVRSWIATDMKVLPHWNMKSADGSIVVGWLASQTDMLSDDWEII